MRLIKGLFFTLILSFSASALSGYTLPWQIRLTGDTATVTKWKANNDTMAAWATRAADTITRKIPRNANLYRNKDSIFTWMNIDTISGQTKFDTLLGGKRVVVDSVIGNVRGNVIGSATTAGTVTTAAQPNITSVGTLSSLGVSGTVTANLYNGTFAGPVSATSLTANSISCNNISGMFPAFSFASFTRNCTFDTLSSGKRVVCDSVISTIRGDVTGNVTGNVTGSSGSCTGNSATVTNGVYTTGAGTVFLAPNGSAANLTSFPTLNQNTTGTATGWAGNSSGTFPCSLFDGTTYRGVVTARYTKNGNSVTLNIPELTGTLSGGGVNLRTIPSAIRPSGSNYWTAPCVVIENNVRVFAIIHIYNFYIFELTKVNYTALDSGTGGPSNITVSYNIN